MKLSTDLPCPPISRSDGSRLGALPLRSSTLTSYEEICGPGWSRASDPLRSPSLVPRPESSFATSSSLARPMAEADCRPARFVPTRSPAGPWPTRCAGDWWRVNVADAAESAAGQQQPSRRRLAQAPHLDLRPASRLSLHITGERLAPLLELAASTGMRGQGGGSARESWPSSSRCDWAIPRWRPPRHFTATPPRRWIVRREC